MTIEAFLQKWNNGHGLLARSGDEQIDASEIEAGGGEANLLEDFRNLTPVDRSRAANHIKSTELRDRLEVSADPAFARLVQSVDTKHDWRLSAPELSGEAFQRFRSGASTLSPDGRRRLSALIDDRAAEAVGAPLTAALPEAFDPLDFANGRFVNRADRDHAAKARKFVAQVLKLDLRRLQNGLAREHFTPVAIPATPEEAFVRTLHRELAERRIGAVELGARLPSSTPFAAVQLTAAELAAGLEENPERFLGKRYEVTGYPLELHRSNHKRLTYSFIKEKWVNVPVAEAFGRLGSKPGATGRLVEIYERDEGSKLLSGFWVSLASANTSGFDGSQRMRIKGRVDKEDGVYRLFVESGAPAP